MRKNRSDSAIGRSDSSATKASRARSGATRTKVRTGFALFFITMLRATMLRATVLVTAVASLLQAAAPRPASACTTFMLERGGERVVGKSYDWHMGQGLVMVNKRGVAKQSLPAKPGDQPAQWLSRHASVTFNQYGREFPAGGMNDAGLVVEVMWLDSSDTKGRPPPDAERAAVDPVPARQFRHRRRDDRRGARAARVAGLRPRPLPRLRQVGRVRRLRARRRQAGGHAGRARADQSQLRRVGRLGREAAQPPGGSGSLPRFARAARQAATPPAGDPVAAAFGLLDDVRWSESQWNIVYDPVHLRVSFRTRVSRGIKTLDLKQARRVLRAAAALLDIDADASGDVAGRLRPYDVRPRTAPSSNAAFAASATRSPPARST